MSPGANRRLVRLRDSGRVHPNPVFQQSYAFTAAKCVFQAGFTHELGVR
jgi:hypothetical protein